METMGYCYHLLSLSYLTKAVFLLANGDLIFTNNEVVIMLNLWGINLPINVESFSNKQIEYLQYHNQNVYKG